MRVGPKAVSSAYEEGKDTVGDTLSVLCLTGNLCWSIWNLIRTDLSKDHVCGFSVERVK